MNLLMKPSRNFSNTKDTMAQDISLKPGSHINKKNLINILKNEYSYISNLFEVLDMSSRRRNTCDEDDDFSESEEAFNTSESGIFKKNKSKKVGIHIKGKSFPKNIDGLEKELEELRGTPMTYQKKLRKQGLQSRLNKKKKREDIKLKKASLKQLKKGLGNVNGSLKMAKPVLNSEGNIVSNKFDFADKEVKKDNKRKLPASVDINNHDDKLVKKSFCFDNGKDSTQNSNKEDVKITSPMNSKKDVEKTTFHKKEVEVDKHDQAMEEMKPSTKHGPIFNKENKMVFSKVNISESKRKIKKRSDKDPKKILLKLKENSKKISEIQKDDQEKADLLVEKQKWSTALKRASGEKVRDDPELLKKTIAKDKNKKLRSQKKWQARLEKVQKEKDDRQKKRSENIRARKSEKKKKKMKKAIKKGSFVQV